MFKKIEVCDFCNEVTIMGCTGVGPRTEIGIIEVMQMCARCRLSSLYKSIVNVKQDLEETNDLLYGDAEELFAYYETRNRLEEWLDDTRYLVHKTIRHYWERYPLLIHEMNAKSAGRGRTGLYTHFKDGVVNVQLIIVGSDKESDYIRTIVKAYVRDLGLETYSTLYGDQQSIDESSELKKNGDMHFVQ